MLNFLRFGLEHRVNVSRNEILEILFCDSSKKLVDFFYNFSNQTQRYYSHIARKTSLLLLWRLFLKEALQSVQRLCECSG